MCRLLRVPSSRQSAVGRGNGVLPYALRPRIPPRMRPAVLRFAAQNVSAVQDGLLSEVSDLLLLCRGYPSYLAGNHLTVLRDHDAHAVCSVVAGGLSECRGRPDSLNVYRLSRDQRSGREGAAGRL